MSTYYFVSENFKALDELGEDESDIYRKLNSLVAHGTTKDFTAFVESAENWRIFINKPVIVRRKDKTEVRQCKVAMNLCHLAAVNNSRNILKYLIKNGGDLSKECLAKNKKGTGKRYIPQQCVFDLIMFHMPDPVPFVKAFLDESIHCEDLISSYEYTLDFAILHPSIFTKFSEDSKESACNRQISVLNCILNSTDNIYSEQYELLKHPLIESFLTCKWKHYRRFFFLLVLIHFAFVICLSTAAVMLVKIFHKHHNLNSTESNTTMENNTYQKVDVDKSTIAESLNFDVDFIDALNWLTLIFAIILFVHAFIQIRFIPFKRLFFEFEIILNLLTAACATVKCIFVITMSSQWFLDPNYKWIYHLNSIIVLPVWINLMLLIGRFPRLGCYSLMFTTVLQNFFKVMISFIFLLIGFALSFSLAFPDSVYFGNPLYSTLQTIVMMVGEFDYTTTFSLEEKQFLNETPRIIFLFFIVSCSIILMNLTQGIAVNDIKELHEISHIIRLEKETRFLYELECVFTHPIIASHPFLRKIKRQLYDNGMTIMPIRVTRDNRQGLTEEVFDKLKDFKPKDYCRRR